MRPIWKGSISFGLVNIPVALYPATRRSGDVRFHLLRDNDLSPIHYSRVAESDGKEVPWDHIIKGYEYEKGHYVTVSDEDFERVKIKTNQTVDIREFVDLKEIDPMFFDEPYYLAPEKGGEKAYALLRDALAQSGKVGIAKVALRAREHLAAVKPLGKILTVELMHFADELADSKELPVPGEVEAGKKEMAMAQTLIDGMTDQWDPAKYRDEYREALLNMIEEKIAAGGKTLPPLASPSRPGKVVDLVAVLQESLKQAEAAKKAAKAAPPKRRHKAA